MFRQHPVLSLLTVAYLVVVGWITLGPQPLDAGQESMIFRIVAVLQRVEPLAWVRYSTIEFAANVLMFVPIGLFLLLLLGRRRWLVAVVAGALLSGAIEFAQLFLPARVSDPRDLLANSVGALLGVLVALVVTWPAAWRRAREERARRRAVARAA